RAPFPQPAQDAAPPPAAQFARSAPPARGAPPVHGVAPGRHAVSEEGGLTLAQVAARAAVSPATVRRWVREGLVPPYDGVWTPAAASHVRIVARLRERGYTIERIREASQGGMLAFGYVDELLPSSKARYTIEEAGRAIGMEPRLIERLLAAMGLG